MKESLTICSVYHSQESKKLLELNYDLVKTLNPGEPFSWIVADNTPLGFTDKIDGHKFAVIDGVERPDFCPSWIRGSFQHTLALQKILAHIRTRFALFLDIDCYIVRPFWIRDVLDHMRERGLAFFGIPWYPIHFRKYRYFPAHHALFVDLAKIGIDALDFRPQYAEWKEGTLQKSFLPWRVRDSWRKLKGWRRLGIGISRDTGWALYQRFAHNPCIQFECAIPVFRTRPHVLDLLLPDRFSYTPKRKDYFSTSGFREEHHFDAGGIGWEEFLWKGRPFAFHARGSYRAKQNEKDTFAYLHDAFTSFNIL